jgi:cytochrome c peroxidase
VIPPDNPQSPEKVALGRKLFFDDRLSADGTISCDNCHSPGKGFTDQLPTSMGIHHAFGQRNAPTILNALFQYAPVLGWARAIARDPDRRSDPQPGRDGQQITR